MILFTCDHCGVVIPNPDNNAYSIAVHVELFSRNLKPAETLAEGDLAPENMKRVQKLIEDAERRGERYIVEDRPAALELKICKKCCDQLHCKAHMFLGRNKFAHLRN